VVTGCKAILDSDPAAQSGVYSLQEPGGAPYQAYCDMDVDGGGYTRVRSLTLPATAPGWSQAVQVPYLVEVPELPTFDRVLVKLTLDGQYAWASWDAGGSPPETWQLEFGAPKQGDLPAGRFGRNTPLGTPTTLRIQSWSQCYSPNPGTGKYEWGNVVVAGGPCYGTFAFFDVTSTVFAVDKWASLGGPLDLGIGPQPVGHPDWTFAGNGATFSTRKLEWFVKSSGSACPGTCDSATGACSYPETACSSGAYYNHVLITGQSLSTGAAANVVSTTQPFDNVRFNTGVRAGGAGLTSFVPLVETQVGGEGETIAFGMANEATSLVEAAGYTSSPFLMSCNGVGGQPYAALKKGTGPYANGLAQIAAGQSISASLGQSYAFQAVFLVHGESDHLANNLSYEANLAEWQHDYELDAQALTGQTATVPMFLCQMSSYTAYGSSSSLIPQAQLDASLDYAGKIFVVGPKYFLPYSDGVHLTGVGSRWLGEYYAKAYVGTVVQGTPWVPLSPSTVARAGNVITVDFHVPAPPLAFDTSAVSNPGNYGFEYTDASGSPPSIQSVALTGPTTVAITLSATPTGANKRVRYAYTGSPGQPAGPFTGARGNLRDSDATPSLNGSSLYNWCVHFERSVP
jgi:hypothetical protein